MSGIITKGTYLHEKPLYASMTNPLNKPINRGKEEGEEDGHFLSGISEGERKLRKRKSLLGNH